MSKTDQFETNLLKFIFTGVPISSLAATAGSTSLWIGLHTVDPGDAGSTANEGGYTAYTRVQTNRSTASTTALAGWNVTSGSSAAVGSASPVSNITFPQCGTTTTGTFAFVSVNLSSNSTGPDAIYTGTVTPAINFGSGVTPQLTTASSITEE